jgi:hypothetical protein
MTDARAVIVGGIDSMAWLVNHSHSHDERLRWEALLQAAGEDRVAAIKELDRTLAELKRVREAYAAAEEVLSGYNVDWDRPTALGPAIRRLDRARAELRVWSDV